MLRPKEGIPEKPHLIERWDRDQKNFDCKLFCET